MNKKAILWKTVWIIVILMVFIMFLSWLNKRVDLICVLQQMIESFGSCKR